MGCNARLSPVFSLLGDDESLPAQTIWSTRMTTFRPIAPLSLAVNRATVGVAGYADNSPVCFDTLLPAMKSILGNNESFRADASSARHIARGVRRPFSSTWCWAGIRRRGTLSRFRRFIVQGTQSTATHKSTIFGGDGDSILARLSATISTGH